MSYVLSAGTNIDGFGSSVSTLFSVSEVLLVVVEVIVLVDSVPISKLVSVSVVF